MNYLIFLILAITYVYAGPCPDERDPGCCLQFVPVKYKNGTTGTAPLDFDARKNECKWPIGSYGHPTYPYAGNTGGSGSGNPSITVTFPSTTKTSSSRITNSKISVTTSSDARSSTTASVTSTSGMTSRTDTSSRSFTTSSTSEVIVTRSVEIITPSISSSATRTRGSIIALTPTGTKMNEITETEGVVKKDGDITTDNSTNGSTKSIQIISPVFVVILSIFVSMLYLF